MTQWQPYIKSIQENHGVEFLKSQKNHTLFSVSLKCVVEPCYSYPVAWEAEDHRLDILFWFLVLIDSENRIEEGKVFPCCESVLLNKPCINLSNHPLPVCSREV